MKFVLLFIAVAGFVHAAKNVKVTTKVVGDFEFPKSAVLENEGIKNVLQNAVQKLKTKLDMNLDDTVDELLIEVQNLLLDNLLDPLQIPDIHLEFEYKPALITYHGDLFLYQGWLQDIISIHRSGESSVSIEGSDIRAVIPIGFDDLIATFLYSATIMDLGPHGSVHGKLFDVVAYIDVSVNLETMTVTMNEFNLDAGELGLNFYGYGIADWVVNLLIDVLEDVLHSGIVEIMNKVMGEIVNYIVDYLNEILGDLLGRQMALEKSAQAPKLTFGHQMPKINLRHLVKH